MKNIEEKIVFKGSKFDYNIIVKKTYVGAYLSAKKPRQGEDWLRGDDLADGPNTSQTWLRIIRDILDCETGRNYIHKIKRPPQRQWIT